jgi:cell division protein FtsB
MVTLNEPEYLKKKLKNLQKKIDVITKQIKDLEKSDTLQSA